MTLEVPKQTTTIELSMKNYDKLHSIKTKLEKITHKSLSFDKTVSILLTARPLDLMLEEMMLE